MKEIKFKIKNEYNKFLYKILNGIDSKEFVWVIFEDEVYNKVGSDLFQDEIYSDDSFKKIIKDQDYYTVFLKLQMYSIGSKIEKINNYNDFLNSNCQLILFIVDNVFVDIYVKDNNIVEIIKRNLSLNSFENVDIISNEKQIRKYYSMNEFVNL